MAVPTEAKGTGSRVLETPSQVLHDSEHHRSRSENDILARRLSFAVRLRHVLSLSSFDSKVVEKDSPNAQFRIQHVESWNTEDQDQDLSN